MDHSCGILASVYLGWPGRVSREERKSTRYSPPTPHTNKQRPHRRVVKRSRSGRYSVRVDALMYGVSAGECYAFLINCGETSGDTRLVDYFGYHVVCGLLRRVLWRPLNASMLHVPTELHGANHSHPVSLGHFIGCFHIIARG